MSPDKIRAPDDSWYGEFTPGGLLDALTGIGELTPTFPQHDSEGPGLGRPDPRGRRIGSVLQVSYVPPLQPRGDGIHVYGSPLTPDYKGDGRGDLRAELGFSPSQVFII